MVSGERDGGITVLQRQAARGETSRLGPHNVQAPRTHNDPLPAVYGHPGACAICYLGRYLMVLRYLPDFGQVIDVVGKHGGTEHQMR